jgi:ParB family chromosome partitioning protein
LLFGKSADFPHVVEVDVSRVLDNPHQARKHFDEQAIADLATSIEKVGLQQPIIVRKGDADGSFVLVAGERRLRAHRFLKRERIFAIVTTKASPEAISLIENVTRENLNIVELAQGLKSLIDNGGYTQREAASIVGLPENTVTKTLGVLGLATDILAEYPTVADTISASTLIELTYVEDTEIARSLWQRAKTGRLSRADIRAAAATKKAGRQTSERGAEKTEKQALKQLGKTLETVSAGIDALHTEHRERLDDEHRERLRALRARIDALLED